MERTKKIKKLMLKNKVFPIIVLTFVSVDAIFKKFMDYNKKAFMALLFFCFFLVMSLLLLFVVESGCSVHSVLLLCNVFSSYDL